MRILLACLALVLLAAPAAARGCGDHLPRHPSAHVWDYERYLDCLEREIRALRAEQARLKAVVEAQAREIAAIPVPYVNDNGKVSVAGGRPLGRALFRLDSRRTGRAASLALDPAVVEALCARPGGCLLRLARQALGFGFGDPRTTSGAGPCHFDYDPARDAGFAGDGCGGDGRRVLASAGGACLLADSDLNLRPASGEGLLANARGRGLFLIAAPGLAGDGNARFRCDLVLE